MIWKEKKKEAHFRDKNIYFLTKKENQQKSFLILSSGPIQQHQGLPLMTKAQMVLSTQEADIVAVCIYFEILQYENEK